MLLPHIQTRIVKLSSRNLNYLIVAGAAILYTSVFFYIFSERESLHDSLCSVRNYNIKI